MLISSRNTVVDTPRIKFYQVSGHSMVKSSRHKIHHHTWYLVTWYMHQWVFWYSMRAGTSLRTSWSCWSFLWHCRGCYIQTWIYNKALWASLDGRNIKALLSTCLKWLSLSSTLSTKPPYFSSPHSVYVQILPVRSSLIFSFQTHDFFLPIAISRSWLPSPLAISPPVVFLPSLLPPQSLLSTLTLAWRDSVR